MASRTDNMKLLVLVLTVTMASAQFMPPISMIPLIQQFQAYMSTCRTETGVSQGDIDYLMRLQIPESRNAACFAACVGRKSGIINSDNSINAGKVEEMAAPLRNAPGNAYAKMKETLEKCKGAGDTDECSAAKKSMECAINNANQNGLMAAIPSIIG